MNVRDLLSDHLLRLLRRDRIRNTADFTALKGIHSRELLESLRDQLKALPFASKVDLRVFQHSPASSYFRIKFRGHRLGGISIHMSHIAPVFYWRFEPVEGFTPFPEMSVPGIMREYRKYERALVRKVPAEAEALINRVREEFAEFGLIEMAATEFHRTPSNAAKFPKSLRRFQLAFFYFDSIPLFPEDAL